jgi:hypothetical protein
VFAVPIFCIILGDISLLESSMMFAVYFVIIILARYSYALNEGCNVKIDFQENNSGKVCAYILNLDRASDRLRYVLPSISAIGIPFERISAVDGNTLRHDELRLIVD